MNNFHYINVLLDSHYGLQLEDEDVEEMGLIAWNYIGNKNVKLYSYTACIDPTDNSVTLPCNALGNSGEVIIEAVTIPYEDWEYSTNKHSRGDINSAFTESYIEGLKFNTHPYYIPGRYVKFEQVNDKLYFTLNWGTVNILYKGILADEDGLPELTDKEAMAIATYIASATKFREGLITNNPDIVKFADRLELKWKQLCDLARVTYLNQNDMNEILTAKSSWDRSMYAKSFKPIR